MTFSKPLKYLIGLATIWYALYVLVTLAGIVLLFGYVVVSLMSGGEAIVNLRNLLREILSLEIMVPIHICSLLLEVGLLIFYLVHTIRNDKASDAMRIALGLGHLFLPLVAMPIYYYLYIWQEHPPEWATAKTGDSDRLAQNIAL